MTHVTETDRLEQMIRQQVVERGISDVRVLDALRAVPRERFFDEQSQADAFADRASSIGHGQTISQPYIVALMTQRLDVQADHHVLEVGTGSGYQTAVLAQLAAEVYTIERVKPLLDASFDRLGSLGLRNVHFRLGDGSRGWPEHGPFDRILITAGAPAVPEALLLDQLDRRRHCRAARRRHRSAGVVIGHTTRKRAGAGRHLLVPIRPARGRAGLAVACHAASVNLMPLSVRDSSVLRSYVARI